MIFSVSVLGPAIERRVVRDRRPLRRAVGRALRRHGRCRAGRAPARRRRDRRGAGRGRRRRRRGRALRASRPACMRGLGPARSGRSRSSGALVPGCSQILFIVAVRDAGPSRAAILIGTAPLMSVAIALVFLDEPFQPLLRRRHRARRRRRRRACTRARTPGALQRRSAPCSRSPARRLFAVRDNVVRWAARDTAPAAARRRGRRAARRRRSSCSPGCWSARRDRLGERLRAALPAVRARRDHARASPTSACSRRSIAGRVSIVAPLNATQSLWAVVFSALV